MAKKKEIIPAPTNSIEELPVKKVRKPRTSSKPSYAELERRLEATEHMLKISQEQLSQKDAALNNMAADYTRITNYVMKSLNVFYESTIMAFKEDKR